MFLSFNLCFPTNADNISKQMYMTYELYLKLFVLEIRQN